MQALVETLPSSIHWRGDKNNASTERTIPQAHR